MKKSGIGSHQSAKAKTETWLTPRHILDALGKFDLDPCSAPNPELWPTAETHYTWPHNDGLIMPWHGRVWLNPPYGKAMGRWLGKLAQHGQGTSLIFARTETEAFFNHVWQEADAVMFLRGRLHFHLPDGTRAKANGGAPSVLIAYGNEDVERLMESGLDGMMLALKRPVMLHMAFNIDIPSKTWKAIVTDALEELGGKAALAELYKALEDHPKAKANPHYKEKIRQTVGRLGLEKEEEQYTLSMR